MAAAYYTGMATDRSRAVKRGRDAGCGCLRIVATGRARGREPDCLARAGHSAYIAVRDVVNVRDGSLLPPLRLLLCFTLESLMLSTRHGIDLICKTHQAGVTIGPAGQIPDPYPPDSQLQVRHPPSESNTQGP